MKMTKSSEPKRCLKATIYIYLPENNIKWSGLRKMAIRQGGGRVMIYNEFNEPVGKMRAFGNIGHALMMIQDEFTKRARTRVRTKQ